MRKKDWTGKNKVLTYKNQRKVILSGFSKDNPITSMVFDSDTSLNSSVGSKLDFNGLSVKENKCCLESHVIDDTNLRDNELIFIKVDSGNDYIIKPWAMLYRGSMCVTELYSKAEKLWLINMIIKKRVEQ
jgi:hypothetical protein